MLISRTLVKWGYNLKTIYIPNLLLTVQVLRKIGHLPTAMSSSPTRSASPSAAERNTASEMWWMPAHITAKLEGNQSGLMFVGEQLGSPMLFDDHTVGCRFCMGMLNERVFCKRV